MAMGRIPGNSPGGQPAGSLGSARGCLMQHIEDSDFRQLSPPIQGLENLRQGALTHTNKKNAGRSEEVVENTRAQDIMSAENGDFACEITELIANCTTFSRVLHDIFADLRPKIRLSRFLQISSLPFTLPSRRSGEATHPNLPIKAGEDRGARTLPSASHHGPGAGQRGVGLEIGLRPLP